MRSTITTTTHMPIRHTSPQRKPKTITKKRQVMIPTARWYVVSGPLPTETDGRVAELLKGGDSLTYDDGFGTLTPDLLELPVKLFVVLGVALNGHVYAPDMSTWNFKHRICFGDAINNSNIPYIIEASGVCTLDGDGDVSITLQC